eukprot:6401985-Alexandrium_andersonii.AAC.1
MGSSCDNAENMVSGKRDLKSCVSALSTIGSASRRRRRHRPQRVTNRAERPRTRASGVEFKPTCSPMAPRAFWQKAGWPRSPCHLWGASQALLATATKTAAVCALAVLLLAALLQVRLQALRGVRHLHKPSMQVIGLLEVRGVLRP